VWTLGPQVEAKEGKRVPFLSLKVRQCNFRPQKKPHSVDSNTKDCGMPLRWKKKAGPNVLVRGKAHHVGGGKNAVPYFFLVEVKKGKLRGLEGEKKDS